MTENNSKDNDHSIEHVEEPHYSVMLPCGPDQFGEFISGLLGKPQTIERSIRGIFEIGPSEIVNTFHLVDQRIHQQNDASLVQFSVRILYDDDSSILLNSLADYERYTEIRPIASVAVLLSWTYLIQFRNKKAPEKQEINLSFRTNSGEIGMVLSDDGFVIRRSHHWLGSGGIVLRISHTERTWGVDIESLLAGHIKTMLIERTKAELFINKHSGAIGFGAGVLFFLSAILGVIITSSKFIESYLAKIHTIAADVSDSAEVISAKLDFLIEVISTGAWPRFIFGVVVFLVISLILSVVLGTWIGGKADSKAKSYVLLSKVALDRRVKDKSKLRRDWIMFSASILTSIITGIVSNIIFTKYFGVIN